MGSSPIGITLTLKFMEQFYTKQVSKEIFKALLNKKYPTENIPIEYFAFENGGGYVEHGQKIPTYAEVLDWLLNKDIEINVFQERNGNWISLTDLKGKMFLRDDIKEEDLISALDKALLFVLDYVE